MHPKISFEEILRSSWELTKSSKWLWVYGIVLAIFSGGMSFQGGRDFARFMPNGSSTPKDIPEKTLKVLGDATNIVQEWFKTVSPLTWIVLVLGITLVLLLLITIHWILVSWAKASLISGLSKAKSSTITNLTDSSKKGKAKIKDLIIYSFIRSGVLLLILLATLVLVAFLYLAKLSIALIILILVLGILATVIMGIAVSYSSIFAHRYMILLDLRPWSAFKKGLTLFKKNVLSTFVMSVINFIIGIIVGVGATVLLLVVPGIVGFIFLVGKNIEDLPVQQVVIGIIGIIIVGFIFISLLTVLRGILVVFTNSNWNFLFEKLENKKQ